jgi:hypothetical protein
VKRINRTGLGLASVVVITLVSYAFYFHAFIDPVVERQRARLALADSATTNLETAVGPLGTVLLLRDGSWLAIRYKDSHAYPAWSLAVARDSGGTWFESTEHFYGSFRVIRQLQAFNHEAADYTPPPKEPPTDRAEWIRLLAASPDLPTAHQRMERYFQRVR